MMTGKYQAYPEYKDSGILWIGFIPKDWSVSKLGYLINTIVPMRDKPLSLNGDIPWIRIEDFNGKYISGSKTGQGVTNTIIKEMNLKVFPVGTVLCSCSCSMGRTAIVAKPLISNQTFIGLVPGPFLGSEYLYYLMQASEDELTAKGAGAIQQYLSKDEFKSLKFAFPPLGEQTQIANFLDHETAKIDTLIEKQQQLIKLLKEKRQAVISHAVTKGLNPDAPMRDSGVEWLGEVPEHWDVCLIKHKCIEITDGAHISPVTEGGERYFVSIRDIKKGVIDFKKSLLTTPGSFEHLVKAGCMPFAGDILFSKDGTIGETAITPEDIEFVVASSLIILRPNRDYVIPKYLDYLLRSEVVKEQVESFVKGAALRRLSIQNLLKIGGTFPAKSEQLEITSFLDKDLEKFEKLESIAFNLIELLQERRTALISAAVTGKIDVRNWHSPEQNQPNKEDAA